MAINVKGFYDQVYATLASVGKSPPPAVTVSVDEDEEFCTRLTETLKAKEPGITDILSWDVRMDVQKRALPYVAVPNLDPGVLVEELEHVPNVELDILPASLARKFDWKRNANERSLVQFIDMGISPQDVVASFQDTREVADQVDGIDFNDVKVIVRDKRGNTDEQMVFDALKGQGPNVHYFRLGKKRNRAVATISRDDDDLKNQSDEQVYADFLSFAGKKKNLVIKENTDAEDPKRILVCMGNGQLLKKDGVEVKLNPVENALGAYFDRRLHPQDSRGFFEVGRNNESATAVQLNGAASDAAERLYIKAKLTHWIGSMSAKSTEPRKFVLKKLVGALIEPEYEKFDIEVSKQNVENAIEKINDIPTKPRTKTVFSMKASEDLEYAKFYEKLCLSESFGTNDVKVLNRYVAIDSPVRRITPRDLVEAFSKDAENDTKEEVVAWINEAQGVNRRAALSKVADATADPDYAEFEFNIASEKAVYASFAISGIPLDAKGQDQDLVEVDDGKKRQGERLGRAGEITKRRRHALMQNAKSNDNEWRSIDDGRVFCKIQTGEVLFLESDVLPENLQGQGITAPAFDKSQGRFPYQGINYFQEGSVQVGISEAELNNILEKKKVTQVKASELEGSLGSTFSETIKLLNQGITLIESGKSVAGTTAIESLIHDFRKQNTQSHIAEYAADANKMSQKRKEKVASIITNLQKKCEEADEELEIKPSLFKNLGMSVDTAVKGLSSTEQRGRIPSGREDEWRSLQALTPRVEPRGESPSRPNISGVSTSAPSSPGRGAASRI